MVPFARIKRKAFVADADAARKDEEAKVEVETALVVSEELRSSKPAATQSVASLDGVYEAIVSSCHQPSSGSGFRSGGGLARTPAERHFSAGDVDAGGRDDGGADPDRRLG